MQALVVSGRGYSGVTLPLVRDDSRLTQPEITAGRPYTEIPGRAWERRSHGHRQMASHKQQHRRA